MNFKFAICASALAFAAITASATPVTFYGADNGVGPGSAHPGSAAAESASSPVPTDSTS